MRDIALELGICLVAAITVMLFHELVKVCAYVFCKPENRSRLKNVWKIWRFIDPVGLVLGMTSYVPVSKPYFFRIQDKKSNLILGITGFFSLLLLFGVSIGVFQLFVRGVLPQPSTVLGEKILALYLQYVALQSFGMFAANLFPVSVFDMGLIIAGVSAEKYLGIIRSDAVIKVLFVLTLLLDIIHYAGVRLLEVLL